MSKYITNLSQCTHLADTQETLLYGKKNVASKKLLHTLNIFPTYLMYVSRGTLRQLKEKSINLVKSNFSKKGL